MVNTKRLMGTADSESRFHAGGLDPESIVRVTINICSL